jgi:hypothetical protein
MKKNLSLSETTIEMIGEFSEKEGMTFSRSIEILALMSLEREGQNLALSAYLRDVVRRESAAHYNRFAKLIAHAALEAGAAKEAAQQLYFLELMKLADDGDLEDAIGVDPDSPIGKKVIELHNKHKGRFRWRAVQFLKKPLAELSEILAEISA